MITGYDFDDVLIIPKFSDVTSRTEPNVSTTIAGIEYKHPIIPANMDCIATMEMGKMQEQMGGMFIHHRFVNLEHVGSGDFVTVGLKDFGTKEWADRIDKIIVDKHIVIDIAHAHSWAIKPAVEYIKSLNPPTKVIVGNVVTRRAVHDLYNWGADGVKVGIGPGYACSTRAVTGVGYPQFSAIQECAAEADIYGLAVIADGGIESSADVAKAIAAGANAVMIGYLLAGTDEADGKWSAYKETFGIEEVSGAELEEYKAKWPHSLYREYWGQSSEDFQQHWYGVMKEGVVPEGQTQLVQYTGSSEKIIKDLIGGLKSSMSYLGAKTIKEFQAKAEFVARK